MRPIFKTLLELHSKTLWKKSNNFVNCLFVEKKFFYTIYYSPPEYQSKLSTIYCEKSAAILAPAWWLHVEVPLIHWNCRVHFLTAGLPAANISKPVMQGSHDCDNATGRQTSLFVFRQYRPAIASPVNTLKYWHLHYCVNAVNFVQITSV